MKRVLLILLGAVVLWFGFRGLRYALASDETKIEWLLERMEEGYNEGHAGRTVSGFHRDWHHADYPIDREQVRGGVFVMDREQRAQGSGELTRRVSIGREELVIEVSGDHASARFPLTFARLEQGAWHDTWKARVFAELEHGENGWLIVSSRHEDIEGTALSR